MSSVNRLTSVERHDETGTIFKRLDYHYNAADQLVWREEGYYGNGQLTSIHEHHYSYQGAQIALIMDGNALPHNRYVWSPVDGSLLTDERASLVSGEFYGIYWAASDHLGTVGELLDDTEKISEHREYDAFGAIDAVFSEYGGIRPTGLMQSDIAHAGRLWDADADLYFNDARFYDPHTSRFLSEDPIQEGSNWYRYAGNDPINFSDPTGLSQAGNPLNNFYSGLGLKGQAQYEKPSFSQFFLTYCTVCTCDE